MKALHALNSRPIEATPVEWWATPTTRTANTFRDWYAAQPVYTIDNAYAQAEREYDRMRREIAELRFELLRLQDKTR